MPEVNISNFENYIDDVILKRGQSYYNNGRVREIRGMGNNHFLVDVDGTQIYRVEIFVDDSGEIISSGCDCPFTLGEYCKHQAAAFYAIREAENPSIKAEGHNSSASPIKSDLETLLLNESKEKLIKIIIDLTEEYPDIEKRLLFSYAPIEEEVSLSKKLIREYINKAKQRGFIAWRNVGYAVKGAELTLEKAEDKLEKGETAHVVMLCTAVLSIVVDMLQYADDSDGIIGSVITNCISLIESAVMAGIDHLDPKEQKQLFETIFKEALKKRYDGWSDWRWDLLKSCAYFCREPFYRTKLEKQLHDFADEKKNTSWRSDYDQEAIKEIELTIIEYCDGPEQAEAFINDNLKYSRFRKKAILSAFEKEQYERAVQLCLDGEEADRDFRGLVHEWQQYRYKAYEFLGEPEKQRELGYELVLKGEYSYYLKLKELYSAEEWEAVLDRILKALEEKSYNLEIYRKILIEEKLTERLLNTCKRNPSQIKELYPYLIKEYLADVNQLFMEYIEQEAKGAASRREYKKVCELIKIYKKACGSIHGNGLIKDLKEKYPQRPAFLDELGKLK